MVMRVGGLATGMDVEAMVNKLMEAERTPLNRMEERRTVLTWQRDAFREINRSLLELDSLMFDMKLSKSYKSKSVTSSQENAVTATASTSASDGTYNIKVDQLATSEMNIGKELAGETINSTVYNEELVDNTIHFQTFNENGNAVNHEIAVDKNDTVKDVIKKINDQDNNIRAFYDEGSKQVVLEMTRTGKYNEAEGGQEIVFGDDEASQSFFTDTLGLASEANESESGKLIVGTNAEFTYNHGLELTSKDNSYRLNGVDYQFHDVTTENATLTVQNDIDETFDSIVAFVEKYNEVVEIMNKSQTEERHRDFPPLTEEQKKEMSESEIEKWEEKAMSGHLRGESAITNGSFAMRQDWYSDINVDGAYQSLTQIGITTSPDYMDGGKLVIDEEVLKKALNDNPDDVQKLFANNEDGEEQGFIYRLEKTVKSTMGSIRNRAGNTTDTLENYVIGKRIKDLETEISSFEAKMEKIETRYWNQFTQMETAIQRLNDQSAQLFSQFGQ